MVKFDHDKLSSAHFTTQGREFKFIKVPIRINWYPQVFYSGPHNFMDYVKNKRRDHMSGSYIT